MLANVTIEQLIIIILAIVSSITIALVITQYWYLHNLRKRLQIQGKQGDFKAPNIQVKFFQQTAVSSFIIAVPLKENSIFEIPIIFEVVNRGKDTAYDVDIIFRTSKELLYFGKGDLTMETPSIKRGFVERTNEEGAKQSFVISLKNIHPNENIISDFPISISMSTILSLDIPITTKDNVNAVLGIQFEAAFPIDIVVTQTGQDPIAKQLSLKIINASIETIEEFINDFNAERSKANERKYRRMSLFEKIKSWSPDKTDENIALLILDLAKVQTEVISTSTRTVTIYRADRKALSMLMGGRINGRFFIPGLKGIKQWYQNKTNLS